MEVQCLLHDSEEYGLLRWSLKEIAQALGAPIKLLHELVRYGVLKGSDGTYDGFIYTPRTGRVDGAPVELLRPGSGPVWFSSRMVVDEYVRNRRGNPDLHEHSPKASPKYAPIPPNGDFKSDLPTSSSASASKSIAAAVTQDKGKESESAAAPSAEAITARKIVLATLLQTKGAVIQPADLHVRTWAENGITDEQALAALETAQQRRVEDCSDQPIGSGYLNSFITNPKGPAWWSTNELMADKADELLIDQARAGESSNDFRARITAALQAAAA